MTLRTKCPHCGKVQEVPVSLVNKSFTCACKGTFTAVPLVEAKPEPTNNPAEAFASDTQTEVSTESTLSDNEVDNYISDLKVTRNSISTEESQARVSEPPKKILKAEEIQVDDRFAEKLNPAQEALDPNAVDPNAQTEIAPMPRAAEVMPTNLASELMDNSVEMTPVFRQPTSAGARKPAAPPSAEAPPPVNESFRQPTLSKRPPAEKKSDPISGLLEKFPLLKERSIQAAFGVGASIGVLIVAIFLVMKPEPQHIEQADPYLSQLLKPTTTPIAQNRRSIIDDSEIQKQVVAAATATPAPLPADLKPPQSEVAAAVKDEAKEKQKEKKEEIEKKATAKNDDQEKDDDEIQKLPKSLQEKLANALYSGEFDQAIQIASSEKKLLRENERSLLLEARILHGMTKSEAAQIRSEIVKARRADPQSADFMRTQALFQIKNNSKRNDTFSAITMLKSLSFTHSSDPLVYAYLGLAYQSFGRSDLAKTAWDQAIRLHPRFAWVIEMQERIYRQRRDFYMAEQMAHRLSKIPGSETKGYLELANLSTIQKEPDAAMEYYHKAVEAHDSPTTRLALGTYLLDQKPSEAVENFEAGLRLKPTSAQKHELLYERGRGLCKLHQYGPGVSSFKDALKIRADSGLAYYELGKCEISSGSFQTAIQSLATALKYEPRNYEVWMNYGLALAKADQYPKALAALNQSLKLHESDAGHYLAAVVLLHLKRRVEAVNHAKRAARLNPENKEAQNLASRFQ